ncbi:heme lyase CcmF/NrfE family subunit [Aliikangiella marina]|uniref:Heme lyase CcmF/NrfE family subunit n=1 Tax=Aliikangiella marina TaxID=1712262 RepID=A0A545T2J4_9GAMM|nr:heme lyase CcmF/NrfE family subunit [Aliikangiella marina]TQV71429.1 heme lyase CcmF/NrfE family subunit [Aliikangiella marina]
MHAELGQYLIILAFFMCMSLAIFPMIGSFTKNAVLIHSARPLTYLIFTSLLGAFLCLEYSFLIDDFSVSYVASHSNSLLPTIYKITAVWGGHEGSFLLWVLTLAGWMLFVALRTQHFPLIRYCRILSVLGFICLGFVSFMLFTSNPFERTLPFVPIDGSDLNPLLQDLAMIIHPPMLYMGYVGFAVAFAFAIAALIEGKWDAAWARRTRPWAIAAWVCLTIGMMLGSWWAYYELGWGGWWFWDPSENASFMPWIAGTALIHSLAVTDKRDSFKGWTLALSLVTFSLCLFGTFLIRSGVITSVHAFSNDPERGVFILMFLLVIVGASILLFITRAGGITKKVNFDFYSKDMFLLLNNILLISATFVVFFGTIYPMIAEAFGRKLSVGAPWFNAIFPWPMFMLFVLLGIGPLLNWKRHDFSKLIPVLVKIAIVALVLSLIATFSLGEFYLWVLSGLFLSFWIAGSSMFFLSHTTRHANWQSKLSKLSNANLGMVIAHLGVAVTLIGIIISSLHSVEKDLRVGVGQTVEVGGYEFRMLKSEYIKGQNYEASRVSFMVSENGDEITVLAPEKRYYLAGKQIMTEASIDPGLTRDIYVSLGEALDDKQQVWAVRIYVKPFIRWIWMGAIFMGIGGIIAALDRRFRQLPKTAHDSHKTPDKETTQDPIGTTVGESA